MEHPAAIMLLSALLPYNGDDAYAARDWAAAKSFGSKPFMKQSARLRPCAAKSSAGNQRRTAARPGPAECFCAWAASAAAFLPEHCLAPCCRAMGFGGGGGFMEYHSAAFLGHLLPTSFLCVSENQQKTATVRGCWLCPQGFTGPRSAASMQREGVFGQRDFPGTQQQGGSGWGAFFKNQQALDEPSVQFPRISMLTKFLRGAKAAYTACKILGQA